MFYFLRFNEVLTRDLFHIVFDQCSPFYISGHTSGNTMILPFSLLPDPWPHLISGPTLNHEKCMAPPKGGDGGDRGPHLLWFRACTSRKVSHSIEWSDNNQNKHSGNTSESMPSLASSCNQCNVSAFTVLVLLEYSHVVLDMNCSPKKTVTRDPATIFDFLLCLPIQNLEKY